VEEFDHFVASHDGTPLMNSTGNRAGVQALGGFVLDGTNVVQGIDLDGHCFKTRKC